MFKYQKNMCDRYYCIKSFCCLEKLEERFEKINVCITIKARKKHEKLHIQSKDLRHPNVTKLYSLLCMPLLITSFL